MIKSLIVLANELDKRGLSKEASFVDSILKIASSDEGSGESRYIPEDYVTVIASNGEEIDLPKNMSGLKTGFAVIGNPYFMFPEGHEKHDPHWRRKDGDTVIGVEEGTIGAMPVADAYQLFYMAMEEEKEFMDQAFAAQYDDNSYSEYLEQEMIERKTQADPEGEEEELPMFEGMGRRHSTKHWGKNASYTGSTITKLSGTGGWEMSPPLSGDNPDIDVDLFSSDECRACDGRGYYMVKKKCPVCDGEGEFESEFIRPPERAPKAVPQDYLGRRHRRYQGKPSRQYELARRLKENL